MEDFSYFYSRVSSRNITVQVLITLYINNLQLETLLAINHNKITLDRLCYRVWGVILRGDFGQQIYLQTNVYIYLSVFFKTRYNSRTDGNIDMKFYRVFYTLSLVCTTKYYNLPFNCFTKYLALLILNEMVPLFLYMLQNS